MTEIEHIRVWSLAKICAATSLIIGVIFVISGAVFILASSIMATPVPGIPIMDAGSFTLAAVFAIIAVTVYFRFRTLGRNSRMNLRISLGN